MRDPQATLSQAPLSDPGRADLGAHPRRSRRGAWHAAGHGQAQRAHHPDDHPQVSRGDGLRRRGHDPAPRQACGRRSGGGSHARRHGGHDDRRPGADQVAGAIRHVRRAAARNRTARCPQRRWRARAAGCLARGESRRDRRHCRRLRQWSAPTGRGAGGTTRSRERRGSHRRAGLPRHPRGDACAQALMPAGRAVEERLRRANERRRQPRVPRFRPRAVRRRRLVAQARQIPRAGRAQDRELQDQDPFARDTGG